ncbi:hypothetical protein [Streptomyces uncialis]|uniref:Uncharacterized protein n=1 Tax=Streptomyces uncialis TaxID=1048205 RepID=A0A1Q4VC34_9ACTN|nr:hypothetical protein [Streptomyces uncialis]OKH95432.1 hypothetical protein AB852_00810 [Streptomyces uncialis]
MADKIRVTVVMEYAPMKEHYRGASTVAEMAAFDEDVNHFIEFPGEYLDDVVSVTYEGIADA